jgi:hypothetical protein
VVVGSATNVDPGPTIVKERPGWKPVAGAGRTVPGAWWMPSHSWLNANETLQVFAVQSNA